MRLWKLKRKIDLDAESNFEFLIMNFKLFLTFNI